MESSHDEEELRQHLSRSNYNGFTLTDAIRPPLGFEGEIKEGYFKSDDSRLAFNSFVLVVSREKLFEVFSELVSNLHAPLGVLDVLLKKDFHEKGLEVRAESAEEIETVCLLSLFCQYEEMILNDGYLDIEVVSSSSSQGILLSGSKEFIVFGLPFEKVEFILEKYKIYRDDHMQQLSRDYDPYLCTNVYFDKQFNELLVSLGLDCYEG